MTLAIGNDVSRYNITFDPSLANGPIDFSIQKATEGTTYVDLKYEEIWQGVSQIEIRGAYHYQRSGMSWEAQALHFLNISSLHNYHFSVLDLEEYGNVYSDTFFADTRRILDRWRNAGRFVVLYTNINGYNLLYSAMSRLYGTSGITWLNSIPLWLSYPNDMPGHPLTPATRPDWWMHQYTYNGLPSRWGTGGTAVDENVFNGTVDDLRNTLGLSGTVPPSTGEDMQRKVTSFINIRPSAGNTITDLGDLLTGDIITYDREQNVTSGAYTGMWYHIVSVKRFATGQIETPSVDWWCWGRNTEIYAPPIALPVLNVSLKAAGYPDLNIEWTPNG